MDKIRFEELVAEAVARLPAGFCSRLENVDVVVEEWPSRIQLDSARLKQGHTLLGLYQGVPLTRRGRGYGLVVPEKRTIFQRPIGALCRGEDEIRDRIQRVVRHEVAHHFGTGEARLTQLERRQEP